MLGTPERRRQAGRLPLPLIRLRWDGRAKPNDRFWRKGDIRCTLSSQARAFAWRAFLSRSLSGPPNAKYGPATPAMALLARCPI